MDCYDRDGRYLGTGRIGSDGRYTPVAPTGPAGPGQGGTQDLNSGSSGGSSRGGYNSPEI